MDKQLEVRKWKFIKYVSLTLLVLGSAAMMIIGYINLADIPVIGDRLDGWAAVLLSVLGSIMTPNTILGIWIKTIINKRNLQAIDNHLKESGIKPFKEIKQSNLVSKNELKDYFHYQDFHVKVSKTKIIISFPEKRPDVFYKEFGQFQGELMEKIRKDLPTQLI